MDQENETVYIRKTDPNESTVQKVPPDARKTAEIIPKIDLNKIEDEQVDNLKKQPGTESNWLTKLRRPSREVNQDDSLEMNLKPDGT